MTCKWECFVVRLGLRSLQKLIRRIKRWEERGAGGLLNAGIFRLGL